MAENDDGKVESRLAAIGRGFSATPKRIAKLQAQAEALARQPVGKPERSFASVLGSKPAAEQSRRSKFRDQRKANLPKKGPRPTGVSAKLKRQLDDELEDETQEDVVIKG